MNHAARCGQRASRRRAFDIASTGALESSPDMAHPKRTQAFWAPELETLDRAALERLQVARLQKTLARARRSPHYRRVFRAAGFDPKSFASLADLPRLPFTVKDDLRSDENFPYGLLTVGRDKLVRLHSSSGTTGRPTAVFHTRRDLAAWTDLIARSLWMIGLRPGDVFQNMMGYGLFTGGLGLHYGSERLGALTIPAGAGNSRRQIALMKDFGTTALHIIPSYALRLIDTFREAGEDPKGFSLRLAVLGAEPHSDAARKRIEDLFGIRAYNCYGLSELNGPAVAFECPEQDGLHLWEDSYLAEIVDPETGRGPARRRARRAGPDQPQPRGDAAAALPHARHHQPARRALPLRAHAPAHRAHHRPHRRHAHRQGRQHLPGAGRARADALRRTRERLPDRPRDDQPPRPVHGPRRAQARRLPRRPARCWRRCAGASRTNCAARSS